MKLYTNPQAQIILFSAEDVLTSSGITIEAVGSPMTIGWDEFGLNGEPHDFCQLTATEKQHY